jgi:putative hydrolase of the HAD superfamily
MNSLGIKAVLFDLDDTLYEERQFYRSGFAVVGEFLERRGMGRTGKTAALLEYFHDHDNQQQVFQKLAGQLGFPLDWVPELVAAFRSHPPQICLAPDALTVLPRLRGDYRLGCVTNGWAEVQRRKIKALGLEPLLDAIVIADDFGIEFWKPHRRPFLECCARLGVSPRESMFVGDYPERDIRGARSAGLACAWLQRPGGYFTTREPADPDTQADAVVHNLYELEAWLNQMRVTPTPSVSTRDGLSHV